MLGLYGYTTLSIPNRIVQYVTYGLTILYINIVMTIEYTQLRIWVKTLKKLRRIYAETGESMIAIVDRLADEELQRLASENAQVQALSVEKE